ncbi:hypothetical protein [Parapedobacter tibetensis]|uniref:hypothetical protein n=1 Tax=Parapedobacter tibetensis TaxID=2972951 RepID=UPI00214D5888|nr:hypothetical protein [Parapedobacter tibetensis]
MNFYYQPSGRISPLCFLFLLVSGLLLMPLLALAYTYTIWYIPIIYFNVLLTGLFGVGIGWIANRFVIGKGKVRNMMLGILFTFLLALVAQYFHWAIWASLVMNAGEVYGNERMGVVASNMVIDQVIFLLVHPVILFDLVKEMNGYGTWGIKGNTISGVFLTCIWITEALIITVIPLFMAWARVRKPFSEQGEVWFMEKELNPHEFIENGEHVKISLEKGDYSVIENLEIYKNEKDEHAVLTLFYSDHEEYFLTINNKLPKYDKNGKITFKDNLLIEYITLNKETGRLLNKMA